MTDIFDCKILLVDDEPELCAMVQDILRGERFSRVFTADFVASAMDMFDSIQPDALILDVNLPGMEGFSLFETLNLHCTLPALFLSARDQDEDRLCGLELGADDYITKLFLPKELVLRLSAVLRRSYFRNILNDSKPVIQLGDKSTSTFVLAWSFA